MINGIKKYAWVLMLLTMISCSRQNQYQEAEDYIMKELDNRFYAAESGKIDEESKNKLKAINKRAGELVLMSKDIENLKAIVKFSNFYFDSLAKALQMDNAAYLQVDAFMDINEISLVIRQNELSAVNEISFKAGLNNIQLSAAQ